MKVKTKKQPIQQRVHGTLEAGLYALEPKEKTNSGAALYPIFYWQEVLAYSKDMLAEAWKDATEAGAVPTDEDMRAAGPGERIVGESEHFSCLATVQLPRSNFDRELFIKRLCKKYKLNATAVDSLADDCKKPSAPPLSKRVVEA
jgi:hypothetical protein